jgi:hypothetical protein
LVNRALAAAAAAGAGLPAYAAATGHAAYAAATGHAAYATAASRAAYAAATGHAAYAAATGHAAYATAAGRAAAASGSTVAARASRAAAASPICLAEARIPPCLASRIRIPGTGQEDHVAAIVFATVIAFGPARIGDAWSGRQAIWTDGRADVAGGGSKDTEVGDALGLRAVAGSARGVHSWIDSQVVRGETDRRAAEAGRHTTASTHTGCATVCVGLDPVRALV